MGYGIHGLISFWLLVNANQAETITPATQFHGGYPSAQAKRGRWGGMLFAGLSEGLALGIFMINQPKKQINYAQYLESIRDRRDTASLSERIQ
jgi:hypothetical protein